MRIPFILAVFIFAVVNAMGQKSSTSKLNPWSFEYRDSVNGTYKGSEYPSFDLTTLDGRRITNESSKGKITFFSFWFESCAGCRQEIPEMNALYDSLKDNARFQFVAITFDSEESLPDFIAKFNIHFPVATVGHEEELERLNHHNGYPSLAIIDKEGRINLIGDSKYSVNWLLTVLRGLL